MSTIIEELRNAKRDFRVGPICPLHILTAEENVALKAARDRGVTWKRLAEILASSTYPSLDQVAANSVSRHVRGECACGKGQA